MRTGPFKSLLLVTAVVLSPLMISCNFVKVSKPTFAPYENEVDEANYKTAINSFSTVFNNGLFSLVSTINASTSVKQITKNASGKELLKEVTSISSVRTLRVDKGRELGELKILNKGKGDASSLGIYIDSSNSKTSTTTAFQINSVKIGRIYSDF